MAPAPYAKEQFVWLKQTVFGYGPFGAAVKAKPLRFVELKQNGPGAVRETALCLAQTNRFWIRPLLLSRQSKCDLLSSKKTFCLGPLLCWVVLNRAGCGVVRCLADPGHSSHSHTRICGVALALLIDRSPMFGPCERPQKLDVCAEAKTHTAEACGSCAACGPIL